MSRHSTATLAAAAALLVTISLGTAVNAQSAKEGGASRPITLTLLDSEAAGELWSKELFIDTVNDLSDGELVIQDAGTSSEGDVAARVRDGEADIGRVFVRGLDEIGGQFRALVAPFVVTDAALQKAIITGPIGEDLLTGLEDEGLDGLALVPGFGRYVIGLDRPLVTPTDLAGARINIPPSATNEAIVRALGAEPDFTSFSDVATLREMGVDGVVTGIGYGSASEFLTANLTVHAVPVIWFADLDTLAQLSPRHREVLRDAAGVVRDALIGAMRDVDSTAAFCAGGGSVVFATDDDRAAIIDATDPVIDELRSDPVTATFLDRIERLKAEMEAGPVPSACWDAGRDASPGRIPDGTYTTAVSRQDALRTGWPDPCALGDANKAVALVIAGDEWVELQSCAGSEFGTGSSGTLIYDGNQVALKEDFLEQGPRYVWNVDGDDLSLELVDPLEDGEESVLRFLFEHTFTRTSS